MKVESVFEEMSASSQKWTPDGGRSSFGEEEEKSDLEKEEKFSTAMAKVNPEQRCDDYYGGEYYDDGGFYNGGSDDYNDELEKESSAAMAKANLGQQRHGAGGETGRVGCGGRRWRRRRR